MILVFGGAGYIGSHMVRRLREDGLEHVVFDNLEKGHAEAVVGSTLVQADLRDIHSLRKAFEAFPTIDVVVNFAAYISVGESVREPAKYWENNTLGVHHLLKVMKERSINKFIFSSTAAIFGEPHYLPMDEAHPKAPTSPYGHTKLAVEHFLDELDVADGLRSVCLRYFNAAGADPSGEIGEDHSPEEHLIPVAMLAALGLTPPLKVFGTDYPTPDGTCVRDYIHVLDLAEAHLLAVEHLRAGGNSRRYNLGNGSGFSVRQVIDTVSKVIGIPVPFELGDRRPGDPATLIGCSESIRKDWKWSPKYTELSSIVATAWKWHSEKLRCNSS